MAIKSTLYTAKPFIKWAGGKGQLLNEIRKKYPVKLGGEINKYAEPFIGGGAVLFDVLNNFNLDEVYISDINKELTHTYITIRDCVDELSQILLAYEKEYLPANTDTRKGIYYEKRAQFNTLKISDDKPLELAALFIFLNRTCFNGLYRVNAKGAFNVPQGDYKNPCIFDENNLQIVSQKLQGTKIICGDYKLAADFIDNKTFAYFDPPYRPLSTTANFTAYAQNGFCDTAQAELASFIDDMSARGAYIVASNSDPKNVDKQDEFFDRLYSAHKISRIQASRAINSNATKRGKVKELLIVNNRERIFMRDFTQWLSGFKSSISDYAYYVDFEKVHKNVNEIKVELNILNSLIGSETIETDFDALITRYPETLKCIPLLLAVRKNEIYAIDSDGEFNYNFEQMNYPVEQYKAFMQKTGLFDLLSKHIIGNLVDYATGVETGLDSNGRKNRGGHLMENLVESCLVNAGLIKDSTYFKEMNIGDIADRWGIDLSALTNEGKTVKRFDFVVKAHSTIFGIETNFYTSSGSKLNETARSYKNIALESNSIDGFEFIWITDGKGWNNARNNLAETFGIMEHIYCIADLEDGVMNRLFI